MSRLLFWTLALALAVLLPFMAWRGYPQADGDTLWFLPGAVSEARGAGLVNALHVNAGDFDVTRHARFVFYPPGFPWFLGKLAAATFGATAQGVYTTLAALNSLALLLAAFAFGRWAEHRPAPCRSEAWVLAFGALLSFGTYASAYSFGRPDYMATALVMTGALWAVAFEARPRLLVVGLGLLLGVLALVHPVAALFASALFGLWASLRFPLRATAAITVPVFVLGVGLMLLLFAASPNGLAASLDGIRRHAAATMVSGTWDDPHKDKPLKFLFLHSYATGYGFLVLLGTALGGATIRRRWHHWREGRGTKAGIVLFALFLLLFTYDFVVTAWDRAYNLWVFTPVTLWIILACGNEAYDAMKSERLRRIGFAVTLVVLLGTASGLAHRLLLFPYALADRAGSLDAARAKVAALLAERQDRPGVVFVSKSLWNLFDDYDGPSPLAVRAYAFDPALWADRNPRYVILQQRFTRYVTPPALSLPGFRLVWDDFTAEKPRLLGLALSPTMPSYRLAFYERIGEGVGVVPAAAK